jgi:lia operon protein LiaG
MRWSRSLHIPLALSAVALTQALSTPARGQTAQRYTLDGNDVEVWNLAGSVRVEGARERGSTEVEVTRRGPDASQLKVETGRLRGRETLRVVYPANRIVFAGNTRTNDRRGYSESRTSLYVRDDGTFDDRGDEGRGQRVEIRSSGDGLEASADVRITVPRGQRLTIHLAAGEATVTNVDGDIAVAVHAADVTTTSTRGNLTLDTGSGAVSVSDADGALTIDAGSGGATLTRVSGPSIMIDAGSGGVRATDVTTSELDLDSGSGRVSLRGVRSRDVRLDAGSGSVELQLLTDVDELTVDSGSGSVTIQVPESLGAMVSAESGSGGVDFDFPVTITRRSRHSLSGQIGDGRGRIVVETGSGSVVFQRTSSR